MSDAGTPTRQAQQSSSARGSPISPYAQPYGADMRPTPRIPSRRSPVVKLGTSAGDLNVPGPGAYSPTLATKPTPSSWTMGDRNARKSSVGGITDSPGPVYSLRGSVAKQVSSPVPSAPQYGFGTEPRLQGSPETTCAPGPGAYSPRLTRMSAPSDTQTVFVGQLTSATTPRTSTHMVEGNWSRKGADRELLRVIPGPGAETYSPRIGYTRTKQPEFSMRDVGVRQMCDPGGEVSPGPLGYNPQYKSRFGGGAFGDSPRYSIAKKDEAANLKRYISAEHCTVLQGRQAPPPDTYTPLEQMGITSYTISNTSTHWPRYTFGTEVRPCAP